MSRAVAFALLAGLIAGCGAPYATGTRAELVPGGVAKTRIVDDRRLHWVETRADAEQPQRPVLFIHGTPGTWEAFAGYLNDSALRERFRLLAVDRPGFGASDPGVLEVTLAGQAKLIAEILEPGDKAILVGHSLGGPIAAQLALDYPERVGGLVLVAGSFDPALENPRWYNRLADLAPIRWLLPDAVVAANEEVMVLRAELEALAPRLQTLNVPVIAIQGMTDRLVYPPNVDFLDDRAPDMLDVQRVANAGHFILWEQPERVRAAILAVADAIAGQGVR